MKYKLKNTIFECDEDPICNLCQSHLIFNIIKIKYESHKNINRCSNLNCVSNVRKLKRKETWESFLPIEEYNKISKKMYDIMILNNRLRKEFWISRGYTEIEANEKISEMQSKSSQKVRNRFIVSKENLKNNGFSDDEIKNICQTPSMLSFWIKKGLSEEEAKSELNKSQSNASNHVDWGKKLLPSNIEYWVSRGLSEEESKLKVSESQRTFSKQKCIEKHGEEEGIKIFNNRTERWRHSLSKNGNLKIGYSKISQEIFKDISNLVGRNDFLFATNNDEYRLNKKNGGKWLYDFTDLKNKKIIEYNGDLYHANPLFYDKTDTPHPFRKNITSSDIWKKDEEKIKIANENGFKVLVIWDSEFKKNREETIQKCINFIKS